MASFKEEIQKLQQSPIVELYQIDFTKCVNYDATLGGPGLVYVTPYRNSTSNLTFNSQTYQYAAIYVNGPTVEMGGKIPTTTMRMDPNWTSIKDAITKYTFEGLRSTEVTKIRIYNTMIASPSEAQYQYYIIDSFELSPNELTFTLTLNNYGIDQLKGSATNTIPTGKCALKYRKWNATTSSFEYTPYAEGGCPYGNPSEAAKFSNVPTFGTRYYTATDSTAAGPSTDVASLRLACCLKRFDPNNAGLPLPIKTSITRSTSLSGKGCQ